jgi:hypothetical protein
MDPQAEHTRLYRISWRWRALCAAIIFFPAGWFATGFIAAQNLDRTGLFLTENYGIVRPIYVSPEYGSAPYFIGALMSSFASAAIVLTIARARHPQAYWPLRDKK